MIDQLILSSLQKATTAAVTASAVPDLPVKYLGITFHIPDDGKWLETVFIPNNQDYGWNSGTNFMGLFRLILHWPIDARGAYIPMQNLASICEPFKRSAQFDNFTITQDANLKGVLEEGTELILPASIRYQWFAVT